jgi:cation transport ATPase
MTIFSILIIKNVRAMQNRVRNTGKVTNQEKSDTNHTNHRRRKVDRQILIMLLVQVVLLFLFTSPHAFQKVYTSFTVSPPTSSLEGAIQNCIFNIFTCLTFLASGMPFYIYTLFGGSTFRNAFFDLMKNMYRKISCPNRINQTS